MTKQNSNKPTEPSVTSLASSQNSHMAIVCPIHNINLLGLGLFCSICEHGYDLDLDMNPMIMLDDFSPP